MYNRVLLKLSGEALAKSDGQYNPEVLASIASQVKEIVNLGVELAIVVGGGNYIRGKFAESLGIERVQADYMGMLATVMNAIAIQSALERVGLVTRVQTAIEMNKIAEPVIARRAVRHLEKKRVVIFGAGTGSPFFSTDTTAALRASEIKADVVLMAKNGVDGVYSNDPKIDPTATKYDILSYMDLLSNNLAVMDATATSLCMENGMDLIVFDMNEVGNIKKAVLKEKLGTKITKEGA